MKHAGLAYEDRLPWHVRMRDRWVRLGEKRHQVRSEGIPSPAAIDEATDYYRGLYVGKDPDPVLFARLLRRRGIPDWFNPYDAAQEEYHLIHREGFLWADVQFLVGALLHKAKNPMQEESKDQALRLHNAQICWMMVLQQTKGQWPRSLREIHGDNLSSITMEAFFNADLLLWGICPGSWVHRDYMR